MHRVSGVEAAFLYGETPSWHMHVSAVLLVDPTEAGGQFTFERFCDHIASRVHLAPQFLWRLVEVPLGLDRPVFIDDVDFSVDAHLNCVTVPSPGDTGELGRLIGDLVARKLDRTRPLWEMWFIQGLADGRVAILAKGAKPIEIRRGLPGDPRDKHARYLEAAVEGIVIGCCYMPNGNLSS